MRAEPLSSFRFRRVVGANQDLLGHADRRCREEIRVAARIGQAIGLSSDPASTPWSRALEFVPPGQVLPAVSPLAADA